MPLPDKLRTARHRAGLTQRQLAERADLHPMAVSMFERGVRTPSLATIHRLAEALRTTPSALVR